jgi:hypothetical protein
MMITLAIQIQSELSYFTIHVPVNQPEGIHP